VQALCNHLCVLAALRPSYVKFLSRWRCVHGLVESHAVQRAMLLIHAVIHGKYHDSVDHVEPVTAVMEMLLTLLPSPTIMSAVCSASVPSFGAPWCVSLWYCSLLGMW
jgi:hypothetical protein